MLYKLLTNEKRWFIIYHAFGDMAQLVERYVRNVQATSSNLVISTKIRELLLLQIEAGVLSLYFR